MSQYKIITIEGPDKHGKSTVFEALKKIFPDFEFIKFPNKEYLSGEILYEILDEKRPMEPYSFQALQIVNRLETYGKLNPYKTFITDRGKMSGIVYALADGLDETWVRKTADFLPDPDCTILLVGKAYGKDTGVYSDDEYQERIKELYKREGLRSNAICVSNEQPIGDVVSEIVGIIERCSV